MQARAAAGICSGAGSLISISGACISRCEFTPTSPWTPDSAADACRGAFSSSAALPPRLKTNLTAEWRRMQAYSTPVIACKNGTWEPRKTSKLDPGAHVLFSNGALMRSASKPIPAYLSPLMKAFRVSSSVSTRGFSSELIVWKFYEFVL